jgi:site-specific recombinase XerD
MEEPVVLTESFERWLRTLGYAESTVYASTRYVDDFFFYLRGLSAKEIPVAEALTPEIIKAYYAYLQIRRNKRHGGGLSQNYITSNINALKRFVRYLRESGRAVPEIDLRPAAGGGNTRTILTRAEINKLYRACGNDLPGVRDRAILGIYYGCGLRRSEGVALNREDVHLKEKVVHVRHGKGYRERYVPMTETIKEDLENYIYVARQKIQGFKRESKQDALFLSMRGGRMSGNSILLRLHKLAAAAGITREAGLHTLRHSIATHLLHSGMSLEDVSGFLGHSTLESTQIYTHPVHE